MVGLAADVISDERLLSLCRAAESGGAVDRMVARYAYEQAVAEWQERDAVWQREHAELVVAERVAQVAEAVWPAVLAGHATHAD